jgi:formylglycine-generating enzyme required for sulfatase activity
MPTEENSTPEPKPAHEKKSFKLTPEVIAILGVLATIIAGLLTSPLLEKWVGNSATPFITAEVPTIQATDTEMAVATILTPVLGPGDVVDAKGVVMVLVPPRPFMMGNNNGNDDEKPAHEVYLDAYYIDKYEVTNSLYKACVDASICVLPRDVRHYDDPQYSNHPVLYIDWQMAQSYCQWRGAGLPTEAEWEKAARGTDNRLFPWGDTASCEQANYADCVGYTTEVGKYKSGASPYGVYDMSGNAWEWVADWYLSDYYQILESNSSNPQGPTSGEYHVIRGGNWESTTNIRTTYRTYGNTYYNDTGFRCARPEMQAATATAITTPIEAVEEQNLPTKMVDAKKVEMVLVPAGEFLMGTDSQDADTSEKPAHKVYLSAYYIDKFETTNMH